MTVKTILFPIDFSPRCEAFAPEVHAVAAHFGAQIRLLHVSPIAASMYSDYDPAMMTMATFQPQMEERDWERLTAFKRRFFGQEPMIELINEAGDPETLIAAHAERADLTMLPTHGRGLFRRALLGSVAAKVLHDTRGPVWTAAHVETDGPASPRQLPKRILAAVDLSERCLPVLRTAGELRCAFGANLRLVHVVPGTEAMPQRFYDTEFTDALVREARERIGAFQREAGLSAPLCVKVGDVAQCVSALAKEDGSDLLLIGRGHCTDTLGSLRTHAYSLITKSRCDVYSV